MRKGFTLIELVVAVALLAMVISFSGVIFKVSIDSYRTARANAEIMQKLRAITDQLNSDFKGLQKDAPIAILFDNSSALRRDRIFFFTAGDLQSVGQNNRPIAGNVARVYYGQTDEILARRQHILTADTGLFDFPGWLGGSFNANIFNDGYNNYYEYDLLSLAEWKTVPKSEYESIVMPVCLDVPPQINTTDPNTLHMLMCQGVSELKIQLGQWYAGGNRCIWRPDVDPFGDGSVNDFGLVSEYGHFFNVPDGSDFGNWKYLGFNFPSKALKFTFTLYDSQGVIEGGRRFTHIVYIGE